MDSDKLTGLTVLRRSLEVRWGWRAIFAVVLAAIGAPFVTLGSVAMIVGGGLLALAIGVLALPLFGPERARTRLLTAAGERLPDADGWVTISGLAGEVGEQLTAPYSKRSCLAFWARDVAADPDDDARDAGMDTEQRAASCDFAIDVGDARVLVAARDAYLAFDRRRAEVISRDGCRREEILLRPGERVVVRGMLVRGSSEDPYRAVARIVGGRRVAIVLQS